MKFLAFTSLLAIAIAAQDVGKSQVAVSSDVIENKEVQFPDIRPEIPVLLEQSVRDYTFQIAGTGGGTMTGGTAVTIGDGKFLTAWHVINSNPNIFVKVGDVFVKAVPSKVPGHADLGMLTAKETCESELLTREPVYGEDVIVRTLYSGQVQFGKVSDLQTDTITVSVRQVDPGAKDGDSGSGVFAKSDGRLIGIVRSINPIEHRAIYAERTVLAPAATAKAVAAPQNCPNGVCPLR